MEISCSSITLTYFSNFPSSHHEIRQGIVGSRQMNCSDPFGLRQRPDMQVVYIYNLR
jgi:hypothetical protein